jgi:hypothetical protein
MLAGRRLEGKGLEWTGGDPNGWQRFNGIVYKWI